MWLTDETDVGEHHNWGKGAVGSIRREKRAPGDGFIDQKRK